ncbi:hypothetical protein WJX84_006658 [Apatococcus fuscideae]|uniref:Uncharacterized protein n=1 Tax=Apatococcus fuscideae TaxID=2026836 RepID=A0AAW1SSK4_9CHLO
MIKPETDTQLKAQRALPIQAAATHLLRRRPRLPGQPKSLRNLNQQHPQLVLPRATLNPAEASHLCGGWGALPLSVLCTL